MMFADLIDDIDFVEHLHQLDSTIPADASLAQVVQQIETQTQCGEAIRGYLNSLQDPALNVHPDVRTAAKQCLALQ